MVSMDTDESHVPSRDALRADLAETKLVVIDLTTQLEECTLKLALGGGANSEKTHVVSEALKTQREQRVVIDALTKEVNGLRQKARLMEAHIDTLTEQERELRKTFDRFVTWIVFFVLCLAAVAACHLCGVTGAAGGYFGDTIANWKKEL